MDIFGREQNDYRHLRELEQRSGQATVTEYLTAGAQAVGRTAHSFTALGGVTHRAFEGEAQVLGFLTNNLQAIQSVIDEILYTEHRLPEFIPIISDVPEGATSYAYRVVDHAGLGRFIDNDGDSAPSANAGVRLVPYPLEYAGIVPEWTIEDLRRAMFTGVALDSETVTAAIRGAMDHIETVGLEGDASRGFKGLTNLGTTGAGKVSRTNASTTISALTPDEMVKFLQAEVLKIITDTKEVFGRTLRSGLCIYLPIEQASAVTHTRLTDINESVWSYFEQHNAWYSYTGQMPMLKWLAELDSSGSSSTDRMIVAVNDRRVMEMAMSIPPRVLTTLNKGYTVCSPIEYKISGLNVKRPSAIRYIDSA